ncbi:uncharacterized protein LOC144175891 isoform X1 [Haemaphysalis longicornis]
MAERKESDGLTFKEMRFKMCRFLEEQGIINELRARLRYKFVEALKISTQNTRRSSQTLLHQVILWLVQDYLSSQGYDYTLSTLACESGVSQEPFSTQDVEQLLRLPPQPEPRQPSGGLLQRIVARMMRTPQTTSAQTSVAVHTARPEGPVQAELEQLRCSVAEAQQRLHELEEQLARSAPLAEKTSTPLRAARKQQPTHQAVHHVSMLTQLSSSDPVTSRLEGSSLSTSSSSRQQRSSGGRQGGSNVSSLSSLPLDRARRRLQQLALQTDFLDERLHAVNAGADDGSPPLPLWISISRETSFTARNRRTPSASDSFDAG